MQKIDIYVKNLNSRSDRMEKINTIFNNFKNINIIRVESIEHEIGNIGNFLTMQKCLKIAKDLNLKNILIIEDDCLPLDMESFEKRLFEIKKYLDENDDWNLFSGGGFNINEENIIKIKDINNKILEINKSNFAHMYWFNHMVYDLFLNAEINERSRIPIYWHNKINCLIAVPLLATQYDGYSNINKVYTDYNYSINFQNKLLINYFEKNNIN